MNYEVYFPRGIAKGNSFCNRKDERARLLKNIKTGQHTLLMSPRRYGKTSLVFYVINEVELPFGDADLFVAVDVGKIEQAILAGIRKVIAAVGTPTDQALSILRDYFKNKNTQWTVGTQGVNVVLAPSPHADPATNILEALQALENLLQKKKKRAVLFLDEVQEIGEIPGGKGIEGAIRHVAQQTKYLSLIFSGSKRHLLAQMFYGKSRPLYKLCDRIVLDRIDQAEYIDHINKFAVKRWGKKLDEIVLDRIFQLTDLHPYYVNNLCLRLWEADLNDLPEPSNVTNCWQIMLKEELSEISRELSDLSVGQRKVLSIIANGQKSGLTSKEVLRILDLNSSSVIEAIRALSQKDYIEKLENNEYRIIDPLIKASLLNFS